ncbi:TPA: hypothetical protein QHR34_004099 [Raoultella ornithinolytica]|nr:hypothetical protein [Raoultella ornithinolytica]HDT1249928.1 hypothetical protein [Raoultella ornithinolytica]
MKQYLIISFLCFIIGFVSCFAVNTYVESREQTAVEMTIKQTQSTIANEFEKQKVELKSLAKNNKTQTTTIIKNNQPIYSQVCIDDAGIEQLKKFKEDSK